MWLTGEKSRCLDNLTTMRKESKEPSDSFFFSADLKCGFPPSFSFFLTFYFVYRDVVSFSGMKSSQQQQLGGEGDCR